MKNLFSLFPFFIVLLLLSACVPAKKYKDLLEREKVCSEELAKFKKSNPDFTCIYATINANTEKKTLTSITKSIIHDGVVIEHHIGYNFITFKNIQVHDTNQWRHI